ncbi:MAG: QacE family quaternary ammonium compound efflux SMR transporter [Euryarchaeota archaeon]|nr:QacE family quaternary ammonium compound efflux SMR transporter [Euryarchaeota archaeon]MEC7431580.1 multidrug efflux SMR transporter [Candidatus Thermoplasmatota archaeon]MEC7639639.1 multidrug efflux SMR transporter [Candidatus Thermoplasmatota archaeon]MEC8362608.1 multidrug efflux SMR transporter [Candidatus Thermoplasmatota archaeon]GIR81271.1 MAG: multidrug SMR transporter [Euryarchaeota archaeon]
MGAWAYLMAAIVCEVIATASLKPAEGFSNPLPSAVVMIGYMSAFYFLSLCLEEIPIGIAYAVWSGVGIVSIAVLSYLIYNQRPDLSAIVGMAFVIVGIVIMRLFSEFPVD